MPTFDPLTMIPQAVGTLTGMAVAGWEDQRQLNQQKKLQKLQIEGQKELGQFNQGLAMDTWNKTSYPAQVKKMQQAGLNVGLMYGGAGSGGTTSGGQAGAVAGGQARQGGGNELGMGMQMGLATQLQQAQIENIKADTEVKKAEVPQKTATTTETGARTTNIQQGTENAKVQGEILQYEKDLKRIATETANQTQWEIIQQARTATQKLEAELQTATAEGKIKQETANAIIQQANQTTAEQQLRMAATKAGIIKTGAETEETLAKIKRIATDIAQNWARIAQTGQEIDLKTQQLILNKIETEFGTSDAARTKQWTSIVTDVLRQGVDAGMKFKK